jgi:hypothetical protein
MMLAGLGFRLMRCKSVDIGRDPVMTDNKPAARVDVTKDWQATED